MRAQTQLVCRGSEKIYEKLVVSEVPEGCVVTAAPWEPGCGRLPCLVMPLEGEPGAYVVVTPDAEAASASYALAARAQDGSVVETLGRSVSFSQVKWASRANYRLHRDACEQIRCYEESHGLPAALLEVEQVIPDGERMVVRGSVALLAAQGPHDVRLACMDAQLRELPCSFVAMGSGVEEARDSSYVRWWRHSFSVRLPRDSGKLVFAAADLAGTTEPAFFVLQPQRRDELIGVTEHNFMSAGLDPYYAEWLSLHRPTARELALQARAELPERPTFSLVVPLFRTPVDLFREMVGSVEAQSYGDWELVLVNASPEDAALAEAVRAACAADGRVVEVPLEGNRGISGNTNAGVERATGDFVCFLDHDDFIEPDCLFCYATAVCDHPDTDLLYCDEDIYDLDGVFKAPFFKPERDLELLRTKNYVTHLLCIRRALLDRLEPSTADYDGAQDHHLTLQAFEHARRVTHVPRVLYHWRVCETSSAKNADNKSYAAEAGVRAVRAHLERMGEHARVEHGKYPFSYRVLYEPPVPHPLVSVIIPTCDHADVLRTCVDSILEKTTYDNYEIVLVENNSREERTFACYDELVAAHPERVHVERWPGEFNFSKIVNFGAARAKGDYLLLLNNDTELITPEWMERLVGICAREGVGAAGVLLYYPDDTIQHAGVDVVGNAGHLFFDMPRGNDGYFNLVRCQRELSAVTAACMMVTREAFEAVGGFSEELAVAYNDVDFCLKLRDRDYKVIYTPEVELYHYESLSRGVDERGEKRTRVMGEEAELHRRWYRFYAKGDPYFTPNTRQDWPVNSWYHF